MATSEVITLPDLMAARLKAKMLLPSKRAVAYKDGEPTGFKVRYENSNNYIVVPLADLDKIEAKAHC